MTGETESQRAARIHAEQVQAAQIARNDATWAKITSGARVALDKHDPRKTITEQENDHV